MSGGRGFSERHSAKKRSSAAADVKARYSSASLPRPCPPCLPVGRVVSLPVSLFGSNSGLSCKTREGQCSSSSLPSPAAERQLDHLRHHYLSLFLCNFPSRTPTCQMTKPKSHFLAAHARALSRPERGTLERADDRERKEDHHRRRVVDDAASTIIGKRSSFLPSTLRFLTNEEFWEAEKARTTPRAAPSSAMLMIISS